MFVLQLVVVVVMSLMGPAVQADSFHCLVSFQPRDVSLSHAPAGGGPEGPAVPGALQGRLGSLCFTLASFSPLPASPAAVPTLPPTRAGLGCTEGPSESRLGAARHPSPRSPRPSPAKNLSLKDLGAALGPTYPRHMQGRRKVEAGLGVRVPYPPTASISSGAP